MQSFKKLIFCLSLSAISAIGDERFKDEVSFSNDIQPIVKNFCTTCHAGNDPEGDLTLTSYEAVRKHTENGALLDRINDPDDPMPEDGLMPKPMRRLFQTWADTGYLNQSSTPNISPLINEYQKFKPPTITPIDATKGFGLIESIPGHWIGSMKLMGNNYDWMAFDYRAIAPSHVHGIYEAGAIGNLFTSFFTADFKGKKSIMARNGGVLNGIYRTSYFVLDQVKKRGDSRTYRLVDAYGGADIMYMMLTFKGQTMQFDAYTSRLGLKEPKLHMSFKGKRRTSELADSAAKAVGFPKNVSDFQFPNPMPIPTWASEYPLTSASYIFDKKDASLLELAKHSKDPRTIEEMPHLSQLSLTIERNPIIEGKKLLVLLSQQSLTDSSGKFITRGRWIRADLIDTLLSFPEFGAKTNQFTFNYLHPGQYYLTVIADLNEDSYPSPGDISHPSKKIQILPETHQKVNVDGITVKN